MPDDILSTYAQAQPDKPAVIEDRPDGTVVRWTYAELEERSNRLANLLLSLDAGPDAKVLWCGPNSSEVVAVLNAARKTGAIAVPLNYRLSAEEARYVINHSDAEVAYVDHEYVPLFAALRDRGELEKVRHIIAAGGPAPARSPTSGGSDGAAAMSASLSIPAGACRGAAGAAGAGPPAAMMCRTFSSSPRSRSAANSGTYS
jgi:acyl-CoA synthetase (AMP-forming)/AMP-acid ligase II